MRFQPGRPFRRPGRMRVGPRLFGTGSLLGAALLGILGDAHRLFESGQPAEAAPLFARLAQEAEAQGRARLAANLHLQAARSLMAVGRGPEALAHASAGLNIFIRLGMIPRARRAYRTFTRELLDRGMAAEASQLEHDLQAQTGPLEVGDMEDAGAQPTWPRGRLPARCPHCGGAVRSDEVEWIDEHSAECDYCGSVVHTE